MSRNLPTFPSLWHSSLRSVKVFGMNLQKRGREEYGQEVLPQATDGEGEVEDEDGGQEDHHRSPVCSGQRFFK